VVAAAARAAPALCHPAAAVRSSAVRFFAAAATTLGQGLTLVHFSPQLEACLTQ